MIRSLRRRFILSGMIAFGILLLTLLCGVAVTGWWRMEHSAQTYMQAVLEGEAPRRDNGAIPGNPIRRTGPARNPMGYYLVTLDGENEAVDVAEKGIWEPDTDAARELAAQAVATGKQTGRLDGYHFLLERDAQGGARLVLLDHSPQLHMLAELERTAALVSLGCMALLFLILLPISARVVRSYAAHIEKQKQFITNAGHDIKTPVAIIMSNVDAMELIQGENKWSRNIRGQTERLNALLQRLLFLARIDEHSVAPATEILDLGALLAAELEAYGEGIAEKGVRLDCDLSARLRVKASREYMQQLAHVLLDNAVQYVNENGTIGLHLEKKRQKARILLRNSVDALPDCPPEALFDRFYRGDSARTQSGGGYGIGLSAAQAICEMHGGRISAAYEGEHRICFTVELPLRA